MTTVTDRTPSLDERLGELSQYPHQLNRFLNLNDPDDYDADHEPVVAADEAKLFSSAIIDGPEYGKHTIVLDLDVPAKLVPSSTPGNSHLYIDVPVDWAQVERLLTVLAEMGVVQPGYVGASVERGYTSVRLPWVRKYA